MSSTTLTLMSNDKHQFTIEKEIAIKSITIKNMIDEDCVLSVIPLLNVDSKTLALVIEYLNVDDEGDKKKFVEDREISTLLQLTNAANFLDIKDMLDILCQKIADMIKDKSVEEVREIFNITNDFTPEEEQAMRAEYAWAFEK